MQTVKGALKTGITINDVIYKHFEMREATVEDMTTAELDAAQVGGGAHTPIIFNGHMMIRQLVSVSTADGAKKFDGPFTFNMLQKLKPSDYRALRAAQQEVDALGEAE